MHMIQEIDMASVISGMTVTVKLRKVTRARMWLGTRAMGVAARIFGCKVNIETDEAAPAKFSLATITAPCVAGGKALALCDEVGRPIGSQVACAVSCEVGELPIATVKFAVDGNLVSFGETA